MEDQTSIQRGNQIFTRQELKNIKFPTETETYKPISHSLIADIIIENGKSILVDYRLESEDFFVGRYGKQLVGCINFRKKEEDKCLCVGFRNSYDRSMSVNVCVGIKNLTWNSFAFNRDLALLKKHTQKMIVSIEELLIITIFRATGKYKEMLEEIELLKKIRLDDDEGYKTLGLLYGHNILSPRQFTSAVACWDKDKKKDNFSKDLHSLYRICSLVLKNNNPIDFLDRYQDMHNTFLKMLT